MALHILKMRHSAREARGCLSVLGLSHKAPQSRGLTQELVLTILEARSLKSRRIPTGAVRKNPPQASLPATGGCWQPFGVPWLVTTSAPCCLHLHPAFSLCLCVSNFPSLIRTLVTGFRPTLNVE